MQLPWRSLPPPPFARPARPVVRPLATVALLALLVAGETAQSLARRDAHGADPLLSGGALSASGLRAGHWWQPVTHLFLQTGPVSLAVAVALTLVLAGRVLERITGHRHLVQIFLLSGVLGGLGQVGFDALAGRDVPVAGAAAAAMGLLLALACAAPGAPLLAGSWFPERVSVALRRLKAVHGALAALAVTAVAGKASPAAGAMVGGLTGCLYVQALGLHGRRRYRKETVGAEAGLPATVSAASSASWPPGTNPTALRDAGFPPTEAAVSDNSITLISPATAARPARPTRATPRFSDRERRMTAREFIAEKVDPVLEKISREGIGSLTPEERLLLEKACEKMGPPEDRPPA